MEINETPIPAYIPAYTEDEMDLVDSIAAQELGAMEEVFNDGVGWETISDLAASKLGISLESISEDEDADNRLANEVDRLFYGGIARQLGAVRGYAWPAFNPVIPSDVSTPDMTDDEAVDANFAAAYTQAKTHQDIPPSAVSEIRGTTVMVALLGGAPLLYSRQVQVFQGATWVAIYQAGNLVESAEVEATPRMLHRAVKLFNAGTEAGF